MATPTHVQAATPVSAQTTATTGPVIQLTSVAVGNEIIVYGGWGTSDQTPTCSDDKGNTYAAQKKLWGTFNNIGLCGFAAKVVTGGTVNITVAWGGSVGNRMVFAEEKNGLDATTQIDVASVGQGQTNPGTAADAVSTTAFTTVTADCLICACSVATDVTAPTVGSVGTSRSTASDAYGMRSEDWAAGAAGSKTSNFTAAADIEHLSIQIALRPSAGGGAISINVFDQAFPTDGPVLNLLLQPNVFDATTVTEAITAITGVIVFAVSDPVIVSEAVFLGSAVLLSISVVESTTVTDAPVVLLTRLLITVSDSTAVTDARSIGFAQNTLAINVFDAIVMLDVISIITFQGLLVTVFESVGVNRGYAILAWDANTEPDLAGYKIYQGTSPSVYNTIYDVGLTATPATPQYTVQNLTFGTTYYFAVTAYDTAVPPNESGFSAEVSKTPTDVLLGDVDLLMGTLTVNDATTVTDAPAMNMLISPRILETTVIVTEGQALLRPFNAMAPFDAAALTESVTITFTTQASLSVLVNESTVVTDSVNLSGTGSFSVSDATAVTDAVVLMMLVYIQAMAAGQDTTAITDASTAIVVLSGPLVAFDNVLVADGVTVQMSKILLNVFDSILMSDGFSLSPRLVGPGGNSLAGRLTNVAGTSPASVIT